MARTYKRDANGRFASGGSSTGGKGGSSSRPAAVGNRGPRGGKVGTRTEQRRAAKAQQQRSQAFRSKATTGRDARAAYKAAAGAARAAGRLGPANGIRPTTGPRRAPMAARSNAIRTYKPVTVRGKAQQSQRKLRRATDDVVKATRNLLGDLKKGRAERDALIQEVNQWQQKFARRTARAIANRNAPGYRGRISRIDLSVTPGSMMQAGKDIIRRRASRAAAVAARGGRAGARAQEIYNNQLARTGAGTPSSGQNNLRPGPRNTKGTPKPKRKRKPRKPKS